MCGYETWSLSPREEQRFRVFENKVLKVIFGSKTEEVTGEWRKLHSEGGSQFLLCLILLG